MEEIKHLYHVYATCFNKNLHFDAILTLKYKLKGEAYMELKDVIRETMEKDSGISCKKEDIIVKSLTYLGVEE